MDKLITLDGWQKSTRSGSQEGDCVEIKRVDSYLDA
jgi:hypothetical protein